MRGVGQEVKVESDERRAVHTAAQLATARCVRRTAPHMWRDVLEAVIQKLQIELLQLAAAIGSHRFVQVLRQASTKTRVCNAVHRVQRHASPPYVVVAVLTVCLLILTLTFRYFFYYYYFRVVGAIRIC